MRAETFLYDKATGWSVSAFPQLDSDSTLVLAFGCPGADSCPTPLQELSEAFPRAHLIGCSTAGEIFGSTVRDLSVAVAVCQFENTAVRSVCVPVDSSPGSFQAGVSIANSLAQPDLRGILVISDGLSVNGSDLARGLNSRLPPHVAVTGGLAADGARFRKTWVVNGRRRESGIITAAGFYGDHVGFGCGSRGGWDVFGIERLVTRSRGNVLYEIDGEPALALYRRYLGKLASQLPASALLFPLGLRRDREQKRKVVRTILAIDENDGSMTFAGDVPEGSKVRLMRANMDRLVDGAAEAAGLAKGKETSPVLGIAISCVGRRLVMGDRIEEEVEAVQEGLPSGSKLIGFYSYGELSPLNDLSAELFNQTMTLTTLVEH
jgi:hypothetical protein